MGFLQQAVFSNTLPIYHQIMKEITPALNWVPFCIKVATKHKIRKNLELRIFNSNLILISNMYNSHRVL